VANIKPSIYEEVTDVEDYINQVDKKYEKERLERTKVNRERLEASLAAYRLKLESDGIPVTFEIQKKFVAEYNKIKTQEDRKLIANESQQRIQGLINYYKENSKLSKKEEEKKKKLLDQELEIAKLRSQVGEDGKEKSSSQQVLDNFKADLKENGNMMKKSLKDVGDNIGKGLVNIGNMLSGEINAVISSFSQYQSTINTRLQGTASTFQSVEKKLTSTLGMSPFVRTSSLLESLNDLVAQGIAFNLEQRAFLDTIGDKIATTFDVANASLLRIVKLQQQDSTASRLGMEAYLTRYFNEMFQDTAYLSQTFDSVTDALVEATSQMGTKQSVEFEYIVQKWLGSLSAVGTSENTVRAIAEAIGFLGAGNVTALSGSNMQNLLVMAASRAGLDYSSILTQGLNAYTTNSLLQAVVGYMQEIGQGSNQVVRSQYAQTFGLSISDLTAASNLTNMDLASITKNMMSYSGTIEELGYQLDQIDSRVSLPEKIQNLMSNIKFGIGQGIAKNEILAGIFSITNLIESITGGTKIPSILGMGTGIILDTTVENLIKTMMIGGVAMSKLPDLFTGLSQSYNMQSLIGAYGIDTDQITTRGTGLAARASGMTTSMTTMVGQGGSDIANIATMQARGPLEEQQKREQAEQKTSNDIFNYLVYLLDPKLATITQLLGISAGRNVELGAVSSQINSQTEYIMGFGTSVKVSEPEPTMPSENYNDLSQIATDVSGIHGLLKQGITVSISNLTTAVGGFTQ
jgi:hypothetical protein